MLTVAQVPLRLHRRATRPPDLPRLKRFPPAELSITSPIGPPRGHLLQLLNQKDDAQKAFTRAASLTDDPALSEYLFKHSAGTICNELKGKIHE
jgi:hypothetical protein